MQDKSAACGMIYTTYPRASMRARESADLHSQAGAAVAEARDGVHAEAKQRDGGRAILRRRWRLGVGARCADATEQLLEIVRVANLRIRGLCGQKSNKFCFVSCAGRFGIPQSAGSNLRDSEYTHSCAHTTALDVQCSRSRKSHAREHHIIFACDVMVSPLPSVVRAQS